MMWSKTSQPIGQNRHIQPSITQQTLPQPAVRTKENRPSQEVTRYPTTSTNQSNEYDVSLQDHQNNNDENISVIPRRTSAEQQDRNERNISIIPRRSMDKASVSSNKIQWKPNKENIQQSFQEEIATERTKRPKMLQRLDDYNKIGDKETRVNT